MTGQIRLHGVEAFQSAFGVDPVVAAEAGARHSVGIYGWNTPSMDGFELSETDDHILALHLGGSRQVREVTDHGLSRTCSAPGRVTLLPAGHRVVYRTAGPIRLMTLHVEPCRRWSRQLRSINRLSNPLFAFRDPYVRTSMETLLRVVSSGNSASSSYIDKVTDALLSHLVEQVVADRPDAMTSTVGSEQDMDTEPFYAMIGHIDAHFSEKLSVDDLVRRSGLGRTAATRGFRALTGHSVHGYLTRRRVEAAAQLLLGSPLTLSHIAQETGFCSQSHFTETFRALKGVTPSRFRTLGGVQAR